MTFTESKAEESRNEGAYGSVEESPVGHQRHAHNAQMTRKAFLISSHPVYLDLATFPEELFRSTLLLSQVFLQGS